MNLRAVFLADAVMQNADGTFMVWRGGVTDTLVAAFPAAVQYALLLRLEADPDEAKQLHEMATAVYHKGEQVGPQQTSPLALRAVPGEPRIYLNVVVNLQLMINEPGEGFVQVVFDRAVRVPRVYFTVRPIPGVGPPHGVA